MKRGLVLCKYGTLAASTRQRFVQVMPYLESRGLSVEISPLLDNDYLRPRLSVGVVDKRATFHGFSKRLRQLVKRQEFDFYWIHCEVFPYLPSAFELLVTLQNRPIIYDMDDAIFHQYDCHKNWLVRTALGKKLVPLLRRSDIAFCANAYLLTYMSRYVQRSILVPTVVNVDLYRDKIRPMSADDARSSTPVVGWIGSPSTWPYCRPLLDLLRAMVAAGKIKVLVVGANHAADWDYPFIYRDWCEDREVSDIQEMDIGLMPVEDTPWGRGKSGYKLIQYMACGIPVVASPVGANSDIVLDGRHGFLAGSLEEWELALNRLVNDAERRAQMGDSGRAWIVENFSIQKYGPLIAEAIMSL